MANGLVGCDSLDKLDGSHSLFEKKINAPVHVLVQVRCR
jgi:hypothetical protein